MNKILRKQSGVALVLVMWVLLVLSIITVQICYAAKTNIRTLASFSKGIDAHSLAVSAIREASDKISTVKSETISGGATIEDDGAQSGSYTYTVVDESGRIDINNAETEELASLLRLIRTPTPETLAGRITRYRDRYPGGSITLPSELLNVNGISESLFIGEDGDGDMALGANENDGNDNWPADDGDDVLDFGLERYVRASCPGKVNLNMAPREVLLSVLSKYPDIASAIAGRVNGAAGRINRMDKLSDIDGMTPETLSEIDKKLSVHSSCYHVTARGTTGNTVKEIETYIHVDGAGTQQILFWRET